MKKEKIIIFLIRLYFHFGEKQFRLFRSLRSLKDQKNKYAEIRKKVIRQAIIRHSRTQKVILDKIYNILIDDITLN